MPGPMAATVNIAARVQAVARAGEVCTTEERTLRGVGDPHRVYRLAS